MWIKSTGGRPMNWTKYRNMFKIDASRPRLRKFGFLFGGIFLLIFAWHWYHANQGSLLWGLIAGVFFSAAWLLPRLLKVIYIPWMIMTNGLGFIVTHILLVVLFYVVLTPLGIIMRLTGRDAMNRKWSVDSYWIEHDKADPSDMERMF